MAEDKNVFRRALDAMIEARSRRRRARSTAIREFTAAISAPQEGNGRIRLFFL